MSAKTDSKVALVTGAAVGIGAAIAERLARDDAETHPARTASAQAARLTRHSIACVTRSGPSASTGCSTSIYANISTRFHTPTFGRSSTNESQTASSTDDR